MTENVHHLAHMTNIKNERDTAKMRVVFVALVKSTTF